MTDPDRAILAIILQHEGSDYTDHPLDAGGPTRWGITQRTLAGYLGRPATADDVRALERGTAEDIYRREYIRPFAGLPGGLRENVIDMGVNAGQATAARLVQTLAGAAVDGVIGAATLAAVRALHDEPLNELYAGCRLMYYADLVARKPDQAVFLHAWRARALAFVAAFATTIAEAPTAAQSHAMAKAFHTEPGD